MFKYIRQEGEILPPFYYGLAYNNWMELNQVYYWMPFCYVVQAYKWLRNKWYKFQHIESPNDRIIRKLRDDFTFEKQGHLKIAYEQQERYRNAYYECLRTILRMNNISKDLKQTEVERLHKL